MVPTPGCPARLPQGGLLRIAFRRRRVLPALLAVLLLAPGAASAGESPASEPQAEAPAQTQPAAPPEGNPPPAAGQQPAANESNPPAPPEGSSAPAAAQAPPAHPLTLAELPLLVEEQRRQIHELEAVIVKQKEEMAKQKGDLSEQARKIEEMQQQLLSLLRRLDELQGELTAAQSAQGQIQERIQRVEQSAEKVPELPPDVVSAGDFPGSIRIPGTDAAVKFGGRIRFAAVFTLAPLGSDNSFITNSIPVDEPTSPGEGKRVNFNANTSRFNFELRTPTGVGQMRAFIEGDFAGTDNGFRLRHAYAQFRGFLFGQTWSTFADPKNDPEDLDFEGINSEVNVRQPQIRYRWLLPKNFRLEAAAENPVVSLSGGDSVNTIPDLIAAVSWDFLSIGHIQVAALYRDIRGVPSDFPDRLDHARGYGARLSGVVPFRRWNLTDRFIFQVTAGRGIARYINDLNSLGGQDGVFDPATNELEALRVYGWYLDYEHMWKHWEFGKDMKLRSSLIWGYVVENNVDSQPADAYYRTNRFIANLVFSPIRRIDMGIEYLYGTRENKNQASDSSDQVQFVAIFRF